MSILLLIDQANVLYRAYYATRYLHAIRPWLPVVRYLEMLYTCGRKIHHKYRPVNDIKVIFAGESKTMLKRAIIDPNYKSHRGSMKQDKDVIFRNFVHTLDALSHTPGMETLCKDGDEADDVIASIVQNTDKDTVVIFSNDRDLRQLLSHRNAIIYQNPGIFYTSSLFRDEYGIDPDKFVFYKALVGDRGDDISGVYGWGPAKAKKHILSNSWLEQLDIENQKSEYWRAMELVRLRYDASLVAEGLRIQTSNSSIKKLEKNVSEIYSSDKASEEVSLALLRLEEVLCGDPIV